jgi:hypothetical protein
MSNYVCSHCGAAAYYDGRCGDGPVLMCGCDKGRWVNDGRGGYYTNPRNAQAVESENYSDPDYDAWENDRR